MFPSVFFVQINAKEKNIQHIVSEKKSNVAEAAGKERNMAKNKPKNQEHDLKTELHKESKKPNPSPIINKKAQQKQNKKKPNEERKNRQKAEAQRFSDSVQKLQKSIKLSGHSIFQAVDVKAITKINKKSINRKIIVQPVLKECNIGYVKR